MKTVSPPLDSIRRILTTEVHHQNLLVCLRDELRRNWTRPQPQACFKWISRRCSTHILRYHAESQLTKRPQTVSDEARQESNADSARALQEHHSSKERQNCHHDDDSFGE